MESMGTCTLPVTQLANAMRALGEEVTSTDAMKLALSGNAVDNQVCLLALGYHRYHFRCFRRFFKMFLNEPDQKQGVLLLQFVIILTCLILFCNDVRGVWPLAVLWQSWPIQ